MYEESVRTGCKETCPVVIWRENSIYNEINSSQEKQFIASIPLYSNF